MLTTYAMSLTTKMYTAATRAALIDLVSDWLAVSYPYDTRPMTTRVRVREGADDPVFRVEISETDKTNFAIYQTQVTVAALDNRLVFEVHRVLRPTGTAVLPRRKVSLPNQALAKLCLQAAGQLKVRDAEQLIDGQVHLVSQGVQGQALAAFADAPSRQLPIVIEQTLGRVSSALATVDLGSVLIGVAHVFHLTTTDTAKAFNDYRGEKLLTPEAITIIWPTPQQSLQIYDKDAQHVIVPLIEAATASISPVIVPPRTGQRMSGAVITAPPVRSTISAAPVAPKPSQVEVAIPKPAAPDPRVAELESRITSLQQQIDDLTITQDELMENIKYTDQMNAGLIEEKDQANDRLAGYLDQQGLGVPRTPREAVSRGMRLCSNLVFHERSRTSADNVQTQNGKRVLESLLALNDVASHLKTGLIPVHMLEIHLRQRLSGFRDGISDTAKHRFSEDYAIDWNGETVYAEPHIACGDIRIHFYVDRVRRQIVVAYVGRHLRDASTH